MSLDLLQAFGNPTHEGSVNSSDTRRSHSVNDVGLVDEDDFGDFEQPESSEERDEPHDQGIGRLSISPKAIGQQKGLLIDSTTSPPPPSPSFQELNAPLKLAIPIEKESKTSPNTKPDEPTPVTAWPSYGRDRAKSMGKHFPLYSYKDDEDDWGDFEQEPQSEAVDVPKAKNTGPVAQEPLKEKAVQSNSLLDLVDSLDGKSSSTVSSPYRAECMTMQPAAPSNIPPPSVLLSLVMNIFRSIPIEIRDIVNSTSTALMNSQSSTNDSALESLNSKVTVIKASTRIIAGRKLRWKRDTYLAQSMSIGPANAGKASGMKLTGVDRTETRKEDQEAAETVMLWKQQVGGLKSHIARINAQQSDIEIVLPGISGNIPIRTAKTGEGALSALKSCFLCGLKRDERVSGLDANVEDSFGEWWTDHWGHVDCIQFWQEYKDKLKQR
ncbi:MAG: hypothetical protein Q9170_004024 [Blastenia crenularia]